MSSDSPTPRPSQRRRVIESDSDDFTPSGEVLRGPRTPDSESANADTMPIRRSARVGGESLPYTVLNYSNLDEGDDSATEHSTSMCKRLLMSVEAIDEHVHIGHPKPFKPHQIKDLPQDEQQLWEDARIKEYNTLVENGTFIDEKPIDELDRVIPLGETLRYIQARRHPQISNVRAGFQADPWRGLRPVILPHHLTRRLPTVHRPERTHQSIQRSGRCHCRLHAERPAPGRAGVGTQAEEIPQVHQRTRDGLTARQVTLRPRAIRAQLVAQALRVADGLRLRGGVQRAVPLRPTSRTRIHDTGHLR